MKKLEKFEDYKKINEELDGSYKATISKILGYLEKANVILDGAEFENAKQIEKLIGKAMGSCDYLLEQ